MSKNWEGRVVVITGAGSGIGRALAIQVAGEGGQLAISDVNAEGLEETRRGVAALGANVHAAILDVADREAFYAYAEEVVAHYGAVQLVINNAGVALAASVADMTEADIEWIMGINFWGVVHGTKAFLPHMQRAREGHLVNISSLFGLISVPGQAAYNATKFAVRGFTEALRQELDIADSGVSCTCVHPGGIKTNIAVAARRRGKVGENMSAEFFDKLARTTAAEAAATILKGARANKRRVLVGGDAHALDAMQRAMPAGYQRIVGNRVRGQVHVHKAAAGGKASKAAAPSAGPADRV